LLKEQSHAANPAPAGIHASCETHLKCTHINSGEQGGPTRRCLLIYGADTNFLCCFLPSPVYNFTTWLIVVRGDRIQMHDPQAERIRVLESRVQRWRLVSLALMLALVSCLAIGCTFGLIFIINQDDRHEIEIRRMEVEQARQEAQRARQEAEDALQRPRILEKNRDGP
jgi:hypothetical protein